jgi:hypothetical protein
MALVCQTIAQLKASLHAAKPSSHGQHEIPEQAHEHLVLDVTRKLLASQLAYREAV